jgi:hypothetical protein
MTRPSPIAKPERQIPGISACELPAAIAWAPVEPSG